MFFALREAVIQGAFQRQFKFKSLIPQKVEGAALETAINGENVMCYLSCQQGEQVWFLLV